MVDVVRRKEALLSGGLPVTPMRKWHATAPERNGLPVNIAFAPRPNKHEAVEKPRTRFRLRSEEHSGDKML